MLKRISIFAVVLVMMLSVFSFAVFANEPVEPAGTLDDPVTLGQDDMSLEDSTAKKMQFEPMAFVENLNIMGVGMLGIFIVIGAIIVSVFVLNKLTSPKPANKDE